MGLFYRFEPRLMEAVSQTITSFFASSLSTKCQNAVSGGKDSVHVLYASLGQG